MATDVDSINAMFRQTAKQIVRDCYRFLRNEKGMTALQAWNKMKQWRADPLGPPRPTYW